MERIRDVLANAAMLAATLSLVKSAPVAGLGGIITMHERLSNSKTYHVPGGGKRECERRVRQREARA